MSKFVKIFWVLCLFLFTAIVFLYVKIENRRETVAMLNAAAYYANKTTPKYVDEYTLLEKVAAENMHLVYYFTISDKLENYDPSAHRESVLSAFNSFGCNLPKVKSSLLDKGVKFSYKYHSENGVIKTRFLFGKEHCRENA